MWYRRCLSAAPGAHRALVAAATVSGAALIAHRSEKDEKGEFRDTSSGAFREGLSSKAPPLRGTIASCDADGGGGGRARSVEDILGATLDVWRATDGFVMLFTSADDSSAPNGRVVKCIRTPRAVEGPGGGRDGSIGNWCDRLWITTNVHTDKVREIVRDPRCSIGAYDRVGNYFCMQGEVVGAVSTKSGGYYKAVIDGIWAENEWLWEFYQGGPGDERFVLLEFVPTKISTVSTEHGINSESNSWRPAKVSRDADSGDRQQKRSWLSFLSFLWGETVTESDGGHNLGPWREDDQVSKERLEKLRGKFDIDGKPIA